MRDHDVHETTEGTAADRVVDGRRGLQQASQARISERAELVIGVVSPLGTDIEPTLAQLEQSLHSVGYTSKTVRLSELLDAMYPEQTLPAVGEPEYLKRRMTAGDGLRERFGSGAALAALSIGEIWSWRESQSPEPKKLNDDAAISPITEHATLLRTLKHPDEVELLRQVYGERFILVGVSAPEPERRRRVIEQLLAEKVSFTQEDVTPDSEELLRRDSKDPVSDYGQNVRRTFEKADVFVNIGSGRVNSAIDRYIRLLFGDPFVTPERDEMAMAAARVGALRSSAAGRQVGAAITDAEGEIIAVGTNEVPKAGGGQYWPEDEPDDRDYLQETDPNDQFARRVLSEIMNRLQVAGWLRNDLARLSGRDLLTEALRADSLETESPRLAETRVADLIEFGRIMHAEMAALIACARRGVATAGCTLYTTTFPCHECARHIIGAGIVRVVYIAPYPKSLAREMFEGAVAVDSGGDKSKAVVFEHFVGVSPVDYDRLFTAVKRKDRISGKIARWDPRTAAPRLQRLTPILEILDRETTALGLVGDVQAADRRG